MKHAKIYTKHQAKKNKEQQAEGKSQPKAETKSQHVSVVCSPASSHSLAWLPFRGPTFNVLMNPLPALLGFGSFTKNTPTILVESKSEIRLLQLPLSRSPCITNLFPRRYFSCMYNLSSISNRYPMYSLYPIYWRVTVKTYSRISFHCRWSLLVTNTPRVVGVSLNCFQTLHMLYIFRDSSHSEFHSLVINSRCSVYV